MAVLQTYGATAGNREDIYDVLQLVSPEETPLFTRLPDGSASATLHQWVEYTLTSSTGAGDVEGATAVGSTTSSKARVTNYTQILSTNGAVSGTQRKVNAVGSEDEFAYEMKKKMLEWKIAAENALILQSVTSGSSTTARQMDGLLASITTNVVTGQVSASANTVALTETMFNDLLQKIFEAGAVPDTCYVNGFNKRRISQFVTSNTRFVNTDATLKNRINVYESDFGTIAIVLERYMTKSAGVILKEALFRKAWLRKPVSFPLAKRGDLDEFEIVGELTLEHLNERAGGKLSGMATATS